MTVQQLTFKSLPSLPIAEGATSPDLGINAKGAWAWSDTLLKPMYWTGTKWTAGAAGPGTQFMSVPMYFPTAEFGQATRTLWGIGVSPSSHVYAWLAPNQDWDIDDLIGYSVSATPNSGSVTFDLFSNGPIVGMYEIKFLWSN